MWIQLIIFLNYIQKQARTDTDTYIFLHTHVAYFTMSYSLVFTFVHANRDSFYRDCYEWICSYILVLENLIFMSHSEGWTISGTPLDLHDPRLLAMAAAEQHLLEAEYDEYADTSAGGATFCRSAAIIVSYRTNFFFFNTSKKIY